jgi:heme-degrading monooxygenase HmoA
MIGLFFEVVPRDSHHAARYFEFAAALKPELDKNGGVLFADRYTSLDRPGVVLSHQWWKSEEALIRWRQHTRHRAIQRAGREEHFSDYRIRIGRATELAEINATVRSVWVSYYDAEPASRPAGEFYKSVYREQHYLVLDGSPPAAEGHATDAKAFEIIRDYTMHDRAEAPQHYPPVERR